MSALMAAAAYSYGPSTTSDRHEFQRYSGHYAGLCGPTAGAQQSSRVMYDVNFASNNSLLSSTSAAALGDYEAYNTTSVVATSPTPTTYGLGPSTLGGHGLGLGHAGLQYSVQRPGDRLSLAYRHSAPGNHVSPPPPLPPQSSLPPGPGAGFATIYPWMRSVSAGMRTAVTAFI